MNNNLQEITSQISSTLLESIYLLDILEELNSFQTPVAVLLEILRKNVKDSFHNTELCRKIISPPD